VAVNIIAAGAGPINLFAASPIWPIAENHTGLARPALPAAATAIYRGSFIDLDIGSLKIGGGQIMIKKVKDGYKVVSENGKKNLGGPYKTKAAAEKRLRQVEFFKHRKG
jgi:hypothetical protein